MKAKRDGGSQRWNGLDGSMVFLSAKRCRSQCQGSWAGDQGARGVTGACAWAETAGSDSIVPGHEHGPMGRRVLRWGTERGPPSPWGGCGKLLHRRGFQEGCFGLWQIVENGWVAGAFWRGGARGGQEVQGPPSWSARGTIREFDLQNDLQKWKGRSGERPFLFLCPYYQDTKFGGKTGQNSLRLLWWKPWGIREKTFLPYAKGLTSSPHGPKTAWSLEPGAGSR
jgi:hypothetical protein